MKNKILRAIFLVALFITSFTSYVNVSAYNTSLSPSKTTVNPGDTFTIKINISGLTNKLGSANYDLTFNNELFEYVSISSHNNNLVKNTLKIGYFDASGGSNSQDNGTFATVTFKAKSDITTDKTGTFTLKSSGTLDKDGNSISSTNSGTSVKVHVINDNNYLSDLKVGGTTVSGFSKDKTSYEVTTDKSSLVISATSDDSKASISGTGSKNLSYGKNTFSIVVTSEKGTKRTYTVVITRNDVRSSDATLKSLTIGGTSFAFSPEKLDYNLTIDKESISINAIKNNDKAIISGDIGNKKLKYGMNTFKINVKSEKGTTKTYTLNIKRTDARSADNNLKSLSLSSGKINFKASTTTYNVTVDSDISKLTINATLSDSKASFVSGYEPRTVNLSNGNNKILIKVKNEREEVKTYTINVNRDDGRDTNADLEYLKVEEGKVEFNKDITEYKITVENIVNKITINAKAVSSKAKVSITNPTLVVGENKVKVLVTAENGATKEYVITVIRNEENKTLSSDNYLNSIDIEGYTLDFNKETLIYNLSIKNEENLIINAYPSNENSSVTILGNANLKNGSIISIKVVSESGETREYQINISKGNNASKNDSSFNIPTRYIIIIILIIALIILVILIIIKKNKGSSDITNNITSPNGINDVYNNQQGINNSNLTNNNALNIAPQTNNVSNQPNNNIKGSVVNNSDNTSPNVGVSNNAATDVNVKNTVTDNNTNVNANTNNTPTSVNNEVPPAEPKIVNNPSGLTKVCSSCGRRVPYEAGTCPYCMNDF